MDILLPPQKCNSKSQSGKVMRHIRMLVKRNNLRHSYPIIIRIARRKLVSMLQGSIIGEKVRIVDRAKKITKTTIFLLFDFCLM